MNVASTIVVALKALLRNPTRALLTTLGIVIGIAAVITMMEIGTGSSQSIQSSIEKMGANTVLILPGASRRGGVNQGSGSRMSLTPDDCEAILRECVAVGTAVPVVNAGGYQVISGNINYAPNQITGTAPDFLSIRNWEIAEGRNFTLRETNSRATVCLVGSTIVREVFGGNSPIDSELRIKDTAFKVVGVLKSKGANMMGADEDDVIILPWTTARLRLTGLKTGEASDTTSTAATSPSALYPGEGIALYPEPDENLETDTLLIPKFIHVDMIQMVATSPAKVDEAIDEVTLEIPAGKLDSPGESGKICAGRELEEETGYRCENLEWLLTLRPTIAYCDERIEIYVAGNLIPSRQHLDENEYVAVKACSLEELKEKIFAGQIEDSKTIGAILAYEAKYLKDR